MSDRVKIVQVKVICRICAEVLAWIEDRGVLVPDDLSTVEVLQTELCWQFRTRDLIEFQQEHDAARKGLWPKHAALIGSRAGQHVCDIAQAPRLLPLWCSEHGEMEPQYLTTLTAALEHQRRSDPKKLPPIRVRKKSL